MAQADPIRPDQPAQAVPQSRGVRHHLHHARETWRKIPLPLRILLWIIGIIFALWLILFITKGHFLKHPFERLLTHRLERPVEVGGDFQLYLDPLTIKFRADLIDSRIAPLSLVFGDKYRVHRLELRDAAIDLEWSRDGKSNTWTFGDPNRKGEPLNLPLIRRALLAGTTLRHRDPRMQLATDIGFETVKAQDTRFASDVRFSGTGTMRARPFTLRGGLLSPNETVTGGRNSLALHAEAGATVLEVSGTLPGATEIEGADLRLATHGPNLARLFDFLGVAIPETRTYRFTSALTRQGDGKKFSLLSGQSPVGLGGSFAKPHLDVISPQLIARGGVGAALGAAASPLATALAFVDIGDAKSAACGPVLAWATAAAQRTKGGEPRDDVGRGTTAKDEAGKGRAKEKKSQKKKFLGIF